MTSVTSPVAGRVIGLKAVPDPVFSGAIVGAGTAIDPAREPSTVVAPVDGVIVTLYPHAFVIVSDRGHSVLTHLGIETVQLNGAGFDLLVSKGDDVKRGTPVVRWDPAAVEAQGRSPMCPVVALEATEASLSELVDSGDVGVGERLFLWD